MAENEDVKVDDSMISPEVQGEENPLETQKSVTLSNVELEKNKESEIFNSDEPKASDSSLKLSRTKKIAREMKRRSRLREYSEDPEQQRVTDFLRSKNMSERLIDAVLKNGLSDGFDRLLRALGVTSEEMSKFEWKKRFDSNDLPYDSLESETMSSTNSGESSMSPDNLYLKKHFGRTLVRAMKDIVKREPFDPVDYLGNWLINYKVCEERENRRKEFEAELLVQRELSKSPAVDLESEIIDYGEREESLENDWNYEEYEQPEMQR